ncbi:HNH endonuclease signature motif containing protein [Corynebacterium sp.]|uniref:HNH endonuclease signature motif containing protein n=1 Tax=Corynebacterium sp. TaxID=1720 RepID=UPI003735E8D9
MQTTKIPPTAFYSTCADTPAAKQAAALRELELDFWRDIYSKALPEIQVCDWSVYAAKLTAELGYTEQMITNNMHGIETLGHLPLLNSLIERLGHVSIHMLRAISQTLSCKTFWDDEEKQSAVDSFLTNYLTPTKPNQAMPGTRQVVNRLKDFLRQINEDLDEDPDGTEDDTAEEDPHNPRFTIDEHDDGNHTVSTTWDAFTTCKIDAVIRAHAKKHNLSLADAHADILLNGTDVSVTLNVYTAGDIEDAPVWTSTHGFFGPRDSRTAKEEAATTRDIDPAATETTESYTATNRIKAYLEGRDGTCRWPGCNRPAARTDKDHCVNYDDGGPTTAANMICLCRYHHNRKTDGEIRYILDPFTGDVYWLFNDGTYLVDEAEGPLSPKAKKWTRTFAERAQRRRSKPGPTRKPRATAWPEMPPF